MSIQLPQSTDHLNAPDHALSHRVFANDGSAPDKAVVVNSTGKVGINIDNATAYLHLKAGATTVNSAPLKFTSGVLLSSAEAGAIEFVNDTYYATITTSSARKNFLMNSLGLSGGQTLIGGTAVTDILKIQGTSGNGTLTSPAIQSLVGNAGATVALTILNNGNVGIGTTTPAYKLEVVGSTKASSYGVFGTGLTVVGNGNMALYQADYNNGYIGFPSVGNIALMNGNVGIGTTLPTRILGFGGAAIRNIGMERGSVANTAGFALTINAGAATLASTNKNGGVLYLDAGVSTGTGVSSIELRTCVAGSSGTSDNTLSTIIKVSGSTLGFFGVNPVVRPAAYTITNVTPDRSYDANSTTTEELADTLGTLISDLQLLGLLQ